MIGGMAVVAAAGAAANAVEANSATAIVVASSIMAAIDGCDRQKFDVRYRQDRTLLNFKIDRYDVFAHGHRELRNRDVLSVGLVGVERGAIGERHRESGVVRARRADHVFANLQVDHAVQAFQCGEPLTMLRADGGSGVGFVLETDQVQHHQSSSPSMSSSATSTTTL